MSESIRILIAEDLPADTELAQREFRKALPTCVFAKVETRGDYLAALESFRPDLIISDYHMPRLDGMTGLNLALERVPLTQLIIWAGSLAGASESNLKTLETAVPSVLLYPTTG